ncbi:hypothetical protein KAW55_05385 [bacterium]|nr:hypothetical protein [bacterium]
MGEDSLSALEERVGRLLGLVTQSKKEKEGWEKERQSWEKERVAIRSKVEGMLERIEKVIGGKS